MAATHAAPVGSLSRQRRLRRIGIGILYVLFAYVLSGGVPTHDYFVKR